MLANKITASQSVRNYRARLAISLLLIILLGVMTACSPKATVTNGKIRVSGIPGDIKSIVISLETETGLVTFERSVKDGTISPIDLGPEFAGKSYPPGKIRISTFDGDSKEKKYESKEDTTINKSDQTQDIPMSGFKEV